MRRRILRVVRTVWIVAGLSFVVWLWIGFQTVAGAEEALKSDARVTVTEDDDQIYFRPAANARASGLIFLPGGIVDAVAYAPLARRIAEAGYPALLIRLPLRCACTDSQVETLFLHVRSAMSADTVWVLAGHSRGGMLATRFVHETGARPAALVLLGTTHPRDFSLAELTLPITKIYGTEDGIAPYSKMLENKRLLPDSTNWVGIDGGNHVQFGYYRYQLGDNQATISRTAQQKAIDGVLLDALAAIAPPGD